MKYDVIPTPKTCFIVKSEAAETSAMNFVMDIIVKNALLVEVHGSYKFQYKDDVQAVLLAERMLKSRGWLVTRKGDTLTVFKNWRNMLPDSLYFKYSSGSCFILFMIGTVQAIAGLALGFTNPWFLLLMLLGIVQSSIAFKGNYDGI